jgi:hypothetical protein
LLSPLTHSSQGPGQGKHFSQDRSALPTPHCGATSKTIFFLGKSQLFLVEVLFFFILLRSGNGGQKLHLGPGAKMVVPHKKHGIEGKREGSAH